ncbi:MAG: pinensin family lanthipeptide [Cyclobacteriaceae bacterium]
MKNRKLKLNELQVNSFVTDQLFSLKGGATSETQVAESSCIEFNCTVQCEVQLA